MPTYPDLITLPLTVRIGVSTSSVNSFTGETKQFFIRIMSGKESVWEISQRLFQEFALGTAIGNVGGDTRVRVKWSLPPGSWFKINTDGMYATKELQHDRCRGSNSRSQCYLDIGVC